MLYCILIKKKFNLPFQRLKGKRENHIMDAPSFCRKFKCFGQNYASNLRCNMTNKNITLIKYYLNFTRYVANTFKNSHRNISATDRSGATDEFFLQIG